MKKQFKGALLCALASMSLLLSCKKETNMVPFNGTYTTTNEVLHPAPALQSRITGIGQSNLDVSKFIAVSTANLTTPPPFQLAGTATFYAGNGDVFYTSFAGSLSPQSDGTGTIVMTHKVLGGTGRFEHATGSFVGNGIAHPTKPTSGTITYLGCINIIR